MSYTAAVITISDKGARGERIDTSGPAICTILESKGWKIAYTSIIPDEKEQIIYGDIDLDHVDAIRDQLPLLKHRRPELYL